MIAKQVLPFPVVWWLSFKVKLTKVICFAQKLNFFPNTPSSSCIAHKGSVLMWSAAKQHGEDPASRATSNCCRSAAPGKEV